MATRRKRGPSRSSTPVVMACAAEKCQREHVGWAHLRPWCKTHLRPKQPDPNCACSNPTSTAAFTVTVEGFMMCSWCGATLTSPGGSG